MYYVLEYEFWGTFDIKGGFSSLRSFFWNIFDWMHRYTRLSTNCGSPFFKSLFYSLFSIFLHTFQHYVYLLDESFSKTYLKIELVSQLEYVPKNSFLPTSIWSATGTLPYLSNVELQHFLFTFSSSKWAWNWDRKYRAHRIEWDQIQLDCLRNERIKKCRNHISRLLVIRLPLVLITRQVEKKIILFVEINYFLTYFPRLRLAQALA